MANSNGKITSPVGLAGDIYPVLGLSPQNGKYDVAYPCKDTEKKINKWARNKPIKYPSVGVLTDTQRSDKNFGLVAPKSFSESSYDLVCSEWTYAPPTGGSSEPFRMHDFNGYYTGAAIPVRLQRDTYTFDKRTSTISALKFQAIFMVKNLSGGSKTYGDTTNVEIGIDELVPNYIDFNYRMPSRMCWALAYNNHGNILVANAENTLDKSAKGESVLPSIVDLSKWSLGDLINNASPGTTFELIPIINPVADIDVNPLNKNGNISEGAVCFPDGIKLKINVIQSSITSLYVYTASGDMSIYCDVDHYDKIGAFGLKQNPGSFSTYISYVEFYIEGEYTIQNKTSSPYIVIASDFSLDFSQFPTDYGTNYLKSMKCTSVRLSGGYVSTSVNVPANSTLTVYFNTKLTNLQSAFNNQSYYTGRISLKNDSLSETVGYAIYNIRR